MIGNEVGHTALMEAKGAKRIWQWGKQSLATLDAHKYTTLAGTLVFFLLMSMLPFTFWLVLLFGRAGTLTDELLDLELFGWARDLLLYFKHNAEGATAGVSALFLVTTLWSSTGFFYHLRRSGEIIYNYRRKKHGWKVRLSAALFTFLLLVFFAVAGTVLIGANLFTKYLPRWVGWIAVYSLVLVFGFFAAWLLNAYICPYRTRPSDTVSGSAFTAAGWLLASVSFSVYFNLTNQERLYGALSIFIVFLLWLYWMMICFTAGVIYNCRRLEVRGLEHKTL